MIAYNLEGLAVNVTYVDDGLPALDYLLLNQYDLLIASMECPRLNADSLVAALRLSHSSNRDIKTILITSRHEEQITNRVDFDIIMARKSVTEGQLKKTVESLLDSK